MRLDALVARKGNDGKTHWTKIGVAFPRDKGGYSVKLDALPLDGEILLAVPRERLRGGPGPGREPEGEPSYGGDSSDNVPF